MTDSNITYLSGGEQTTINATITELFPALAFNVGVSPSTPTEMEAFVNGLDLIEYPQNFYENILLYKPKILVLCTIDNYIDFLIPSTISKLISKKILCFKFVRS